MIGAVRKFARLVLHTGEGLGVVEREDRASLSRSRSGLRYLGIRDHLIHHQVPRGAAILDVGCGNGSLAKLLSESGYSELSGCDWIPAADLVLPGRSFSYEQLDLNRQGLEPFADSSFDVVICSDVLEHLENPSLLLREICRVLRPGGQALVTLPNAFNLVERLFWLFTGNSTRYKIEQTHDEFGHISVVPANVMRSLCRRSGLRVVNVHGGYGFFDGYIYSRKKIGTLLSYTITWVLEKEGES